MRAALGIVLLLAAGARADVPAGPSVKVAVALVDPARPVQPPGTAPKPEVDLEEALAIEGLKGAIRAEQEQILVDLIAHTSDREVDEKSDYYFRLVELQAKQHRFWRQKSVELAAQADQSKNAKTQQDAVAAAEKAKQYLAKAVKTFKTFTDNDAFRNYPKMDTALFYYAYTQQSAGMMAEARQVFHNLIKNHPASQHVPGAYLVFADYFFRQGDLSNAEAAYKHVLKFPKSTPYWYAMYQVGWIHFNVARMQEALETFFQVAQATRNDKQQEGLRRASLKGFVYAYAEVGKADKARPAFQRVDNSQATEMLQLLGDTYLDSGKSDKAIVIYQELRATEPSSPSACLWQYNLARATASSATTAREVEVCAADVEPLKAWGRASGVTVACTGCASKKRP